MMQDLAERVKSLFAQNAGMNIILIGFRGAGKTAVGRTLAKKLGLQFVSTDELVERKARRSIASIVAKKGWAGFRRMERQAIKDVCRLNGYVIDTGGGVVLNPSNVRALKGCGKVVWLKTDVETAAARIRRDTLARRPSLTGKPLLQEIRRVMKERARMCAAAADFSIDTSKMSVGQAAEKIIKMIGH